MDTSAPIKTGTDFQYWRFSCRCRFVQDVVMPFHWTEMVNMLDVSELNTAVSYVGIPLIYLACGNMT